MSSDPTIADPLELLNHHIQEHFASRSIRILEAGGGSATALDLPRLSTASITTIDIDEHQLERNAYADVKILADLEEVQLTDRYDLIVLYNVIEHLRRPDRALGRLLDGLDEGGLFVVGAPVERSFAGMITKLTPHWFHVWVYRHVFGVPTAGLPGQGPFKTWFHPLARPNRLVEYMKRRGLTPSYLSLYDAGRLAHIQGRHPLLGLLLHAVTGLLNVAFLGSRDVRKGDYHLVFRVSSPQP